MQLQVDVIINSKSRMSSNFRSTSNHGEDWSLVAYSCIKLYLVNVKEINRVGINSGRKYGREGGRI